MALLTVPVHGKILALDGLTPAVGAVTFRTLIELRDVVDNVVYEPATYVATLDGAGEFTIALPATDNPDLVPASWVYQVYISTATWKQTLYVQLPYQVGTVEFSDLTPLAYDPCSPAVLDPPAPFDLSLFVLRSGDTMTGDLHVETDVFVGDDLSVADRLSVAGPSTFGADAAFNANVSVAGNLAVTGSITGEIDAGEITSGKLAYQRLGGTIPENATVTLWNRPTLVTPGTALDSWQWFYNGIRTIYGNEYNLLRVRGVPEDQVVARFMSNLARDGLSTAILEAALSTTVPLFRVLGNGDIQSAGGLSMLPTAPVPVTFNAVAGTANAATISDGVNSGAPYPVATVLQASDNRVYLDGAVANPTGVTVNAQTTLFTITAAHRPTAWTQRAGRTSSGLAARITIKPDGTVVLDQALVAGASISLDGINWRKA